MVAGITESRGLKSDQRDAYALAEKLRVGNLEKSVFKAPREFTRLRELSRIHMTLVGDVVRAQSRLKSLYRGHAERGCAWRASLARAPAAFRSRAITCMGCVIAKRGRLS